MSQTPALAANRHRVYMVFFVVGLARLAHDVSTLRWRGIALESLTKPHRGFDRCPGESRNRI